MGTSSPMPVHAHHAYLANVASNIGGTDRVEPERLDSGIAAAVTSTGG